VLPDKKGEIQITNAIQALCLDGGKVYAIKTTAADYRYDTGIFAEYYDTFLRFALADPECGAELRESLRKML
jgi:UTP-glucose-1-phosphate uridylyltransferase